MSIDSRADPPATSIVTNGLPQPRFAWNRDEVAGAVGDLGTFLPHIIGAITVGGYGTDRHLHLLWTLLSAGRGVLRGADRRATDEGGLGRPAIVPMTPPQVAGAGLVLGIVFFLAGVSGVITRLARVVPPEVAGGIQLGLGISLAGLGLRLLQEQLWLGLVVSLVTLLLLGNRRLPAALAALAIGIVLAQITGTGAPWPQLTLGLRLPVFAWPGWQDIIQGIQLAVIPRSR